MFEENFDYCGETLQTCNDKGSPAFDRFISIEERLVRQKKIDKGFVARSSREVQGRLP